MNAIEEINREIRASKGNPICPICDRLLHNHPHDKNSSPVGDICWGCFINSRPLTKDWDMAEKSKAWAYSHLSAFEQCPRLYHARYVAKSTAYIETPQMKRGNDLHKQLSLRLASKTMPIPLPEDLMPIEPLCKSLERADILHAEMEVAITRDFHTTDYWAPEGWQRGKIDLAVMMSTTTHAAAFDWKTGNPQYEQPFQLEIYGVQLFVRFPHLTDVRVANIWLKEVEQGGKKVTIATPGTPRDYNRTKDFDRLANEMKSRWGTVERATSVGSFPPIKNLFCSGCEVLGCEFRKEKRS